MDFGEMLKVLSSLSGSLMTIFTFVAFIIPRSRNLVVNWLRKALTIDDIKKQLDKQELKYDKLEKKEEERDAVIEDVKKSLENHIKEYKEHSMAAENRDVFFLRTEINNIYNRFMPIGYITAEAKSDIIQAWELYSSINGNSYAKSEVDEVMELPVKF